MYEKLGGYQTNIDWINVNIRPNLSFLGQDIKAFAVIFPFFHEIYEHYIIYCKD